MYYVYMLECADGTLYTGITNNVEKRVAAHNAGASGAKYTRARRPVSLRYFEECGTRGDALKREHTLKQLSREDKLALVS